MAAPEATPDASCTPPVVTASAPEAPPAEGAVLALPASAPQAASAAPDPVAAAPAAIDPAAVAAALKAQFPALFGGAPKPIKLHIQADIQARAPGQFSKRALSAFLHRHTGSTSYLFALSKSTQRFDLDGAAAGELSAEHREAAIAELARRRELQQQRRAQEDEQRAVLDQQRHNRAGLLRDFERTTLTPANFCVLKGVPADELEGLLDIARRERAEAPPMPPREDRRGRPGGHEAHRPPRPHDAQKTRRPDDPNRPRRPNDANRAPRPDQPDRPRRPDGAERPRRPPTERR